MGVHTRVSKNCFFLSLWFICLSRSAPRHGRALCTWRPATSSPYSWRFVIACESFTQMEYGCAGNGPKDMNMPNPVFSLMVKTQRIHAQKFHHWQSEICRSGSKAQPHCRDDFEHFVQKISNQSGPSLLQIATRTSKLHKPWKNFANIC